MWAITAEGALLQCSQTGLSALTEARKARYSRVSRRLGGWKCSCIDHTPDDFPRGVIGLLVPFRNYCPHG